MSDKTGPNPKAPKAPEANATAHASAAVTTIMTATSTLYAPNPQAARRAFEFFAVNIRNLNTRKAYARAASEFAAWCEQHQIADVREVQPVHVAAYIEGLDIAAPSVKQRLAALRMLFDWLVVGQVLPTNPAASVRGPGHSVKVGKTPVLTADEARALLDAIETDTVIGRRDRALIELMVYTFARVGAVTRMRLEDVYAQGGRSWVRLHEKGGKRHDMPCHHKLGASLRAYIERAELSGARRPLFRSAIGRTGRLSDVAMGQADVFRMIGRRAKAAGIDTRIGCHSLRATGITEYLRSGGKLEVAQAMANHESARTTSLYDRRTDQVNAGEVERISI
jgi:site-specific recombinase XerD